MITRLFLLLALIAGSTSSLMASKRILVDLTHQIAIAYQDGQVKFYGRISSGRPGMETPTGSFYVREKELDHVSNLWPKPNGGARMPYMLRITRDGVALHLDPAPDYPASHGCIRMRDGFAQRMYAWAPKWTRVDVIGRAPAHSPAVRLPAYARSQKILRKSVGGGNGGPLAALSSNPKDHRITMAGLNRSSSKSRTSKRKKRNRRDAKRDNGSPLAMLGFKHSKTKSTRSKKRSSKKYKKKHTQRHVSSHHRRHISRSTRRHSKHANPLSAVSSH